MIKMILIIMTIFMLGCLQEQTYEFTIDSEVKIVTVELGMVADDVVKIYGEPYSYHVYKDTCEDELKIWRYVFEDREIYIWFDKNNIVRQITTGRLGNVY